jgi:hypothetical protein
VGKARVPTKFKFDNRGFGCVPAGEFLSLESSSQHTKTSNQEPKNVVIAFSARSLGKNIGVRIFLSRLRATSPRARSIRQQPAAGFRPGFFRCSLMAGSEGRHPAREERRHTRQLRCAGSVTPGRKIVAQGTVPGGTMWYSGNTGSGIEHTTTIVI